MSDYTREQLKERWEQAKIADGDIDPPEGSIFAETLKTIRDCYIPGLWEVRIFPRWFFKRFLDRKIMEPADSAVMSRNEFYDPESEDTQEWGWYSWRYHFDTKEGCYVLELNYNVKTGDTKRLPLVRGILDICLLESATSIIGKFKWRICWLQRIPLLRRIPPKFLFYFEMEKIEEDGEITSLNKTGYSRYGNFEDLDHIITWPKGSDSWGKVKFGVLFDPIHGRSMWLSLDDEEGDASFIVRLGEDRD